MELNLKMHLRPLQRVVLQGIIYMIHNSRVISYDSYEYRSSFLTGLYAHNHGIMTNNGNCTGKRWRDEFEDKTYGMELLFTLKTRLKV